MPDQGIKGGKRGTYVTLDTYSTDERGIVLRNASSMATECP